MSRSRTGAASDRERLTGLQRFLLFTLMVGIVGMDLELLFIGHVQDWLQWVPVALLTVALIPIVWHAALPSHATVRGVRLLMTLFVASGLVGVGLHYRGNQEFELEMYPEMSGTELVRQTLTGATPVLAPGSMALLGLVGLAAVRGLSTGQQHDPSFTEEEVS